MTNVNTQEMDWLLGHIRTLIQYVGDSNGSQEAVQADQIYYDTHIKGRLNAFIGSTIDSKTHIERLNQKVEILERKLSSLKTTTDALTALDSKQQGTLKVILQANKARVDAQIARDEASQSAQMAQSEADGARIVEPDALSLQTIIRRAADAREASEKAASSAIKAITAADKATQSAASLEESNDSASPSADEGEQPESIFEGTSSVNPVEAQMTDSKLPNNPEELVRIARSNADETIRFRNEAQRIASEVKDLASKITQEYDNWSVVQNLFSIAK